MFNKLISGLVILFAIITIHTSAFAQSSADNICGRWQSIDKDLIVDVYKQNNLFKAKIVWFNAGNDKHMHEWTDKNNPDKALRSRKILGMNILNGLTYKSESNSWEDGMIYDAKHGRDWNASAYIDNEGALKVKGYWHIKLIGRTMSFERLSDMAVLK